MNLAKMFKRFRKYRIVIDLLKEALELEPNDLLTLLELLLVYDRLNDKEKVEFMIAIYYLHAYEGGPIQPGDDMRGSQFRWWSIEDLATNNVELDIPPKGTWILQRAVELYHLWKDQADHLSRDQEINLA